MNGLQQLRVLARRIDAATPPQRDRAVDALRALAIAGVIGGHWLVTALVTGGSGHGTVLHDDSPLASMPALAPLSWIFQTLAVFFLVGGYSDWASAPTRCHPDSARASSPPATAATAATWTRARSRCAT